MGQKGAKGLVVIDPTSEQNNNNGDENLLKPEFSQFLEEKFNQLQVNGCLTKERFNDALIILESFNIKRLRNIPLGERLFNTFKKDQSVNTINKNEFIQNITNMIKDPELRILFSFQAIDKEKRNKISRKDFQEFFEESWKTAFRLLGEKVQSSTSQYISIENKINNWANMQIKKINEESGKIFSQLQKDNFILYPQYKEWVQKSDFHSIVASFDKVQVEIPLDLFNIRAESSNL